MRKFRLTTSSGSMSEATPRSEKKKGRVENDLTEDDLRHRLTANKPKPIPGTEEQDRRLKSRVASLMTTESFRKELEEMREADFNKHSKAAKEKNMPKQAKRVTRWDQVENSIYQRSEEVEVVVDSLSMMNASLKIEEALTAMKRQLNRMNTTNNVLLSGLLEERDQQREGVFERTKEGQMYFDRMLLGRFLLKTDFSAEKQRLEAVFEDINIVKTRWERIFLGAHGLQDTDPKNTQPGNPLERRQSKERTIRNINDSFHAWQRAIKNVEKFTEAVEFNKNNIVRDLNNIGKDIVTYSIQTEVALTDDGPKVNPDELYSRLRIKIFFSGSILHQNHQRLERTLGNTREGEETETRPSEGDEQVSQKTGG